MSEFPLPTGENAITVVPAPGVGPGCWAGAPSAVLDPDDGFVVAYRSRTPTTRGATLVVATSPDGEQLTPVATLHRERFAAESLERPALVRTPQGRWRLYVSCATPGSKHWRIDLLDAERAADLADAVPRTVFAGSALVGVKDPVIRRLGDGWQAWICCHPLDVPGEEDRMTTGYATSDDGLAWAWHGIVLASRAGSWDARGARVTAVLADGRASYDGRATKEQNFAERTGLAAPVTQGPAGPANRRDAPHLLAADENGPQRDVRYLDVVELPAGGYRLYYEAPLADGSHELRTELVGA